MKLDNKKQTKHTHTNQKLKKIKLGDLNQKKGKADTKEGSNKGLREHMKQLNYIPRPGTMMHKTRTENNHQTKTKGDMDYLYPETGGHR